MSLDTVFDQVQQVLIDDPKAVKMLIELESFSKNILEPACGEWHISKTLESLWFSVLSSDKIDRWYGDVLDYLDSEIFMNNWHGDIITNPPYSLANEFLLKSMDILRDGAKLAMLLRIQFLEGVKRKKIFDLYPPKTIYVASRNIQCAKNGDFKNATGNASTYCWFIWEKWFKWNPEIKWFNY